MKILVIGATGLIGDKIYKKLTEIKVQSKKNEFISELEIMGTYCTIPVDGLMQLNIINTESVENIFKDFKPNIVIQPAAVSNVEFCEEYPIEAAKINIDATKNIINLCKNYNSKYVFFSTDYLFDGKKGNYKEEDTPSPLNIYGKQKLFIENYIVDNLNDYLIIRTTVVYGWEIKGKNFVTNLINKLSDGQKLFVADDQIGNPTYAFNLAEIIIDLLSNNKFGIYNVVGSTSMDRYSFGKLVCEVFKLNSSLLVPMKTNQLKQKALRPLNSTLDITKLKNNCNLKIIEPKEGLELMFKEKFDTNL